ncbi:MAG TPA: trimethylamine methyltransferase family protein [Methylomirabilota bacterium]|nr:trimethylamine methyltransferase family protein [Methylomirabilota bacterium]
MAKQGLRGGTLRLLTNSDVNSIHSASLEILEQVGLQVQSQKIMDVFKAGGAEVDAAKSRVKIPEHLVKDSLKKAPAKITLAGRTEENDLLLGDNRVFYGLGGTPNPYTLDFETGEFRVSTSEDVVRNTIVGDALPNMSFIMSLAVASDVPPQVAWLHEASIMLKNTVKPIIYSASGAEGARYLLDMAAAVVGGYENLARRPLITLFSESITPLVMPAINEGVIEFAKAKSPVAYVPGPMPGASAPITLAGEHVVCNAESLAGMVLTQLTNPGTPFLYGFNTSVIDMRTGAVCYGAPEWGLGWAMTAQLAEYYSLPTFGSGGGTDSKSPDAQAGVEAFMNAYYNAVGGVSLVHNCGTVAHGSAGSLEMAVICDELINYIQRLLTKIEVNDESMALDLIRKVGPGGSYLAEKHTRAHINEILHPKLFNRQAIPAWKAKGKLTARDEAREKVRTILRDHKVPPLAKEVCDKFDRVLKSASTSMIT